MIHCWHCLVPRDTRLRYRRAAMLKTKTDDFPYADTEAARLLTFALKRHNARGGASIRKLAQQLGFKQASFLSHMASGRVPIPVDRAPELATSLQLDKTDFVTAVLRQRHPSVPWADIIHKPSVSAEDDGPIAELQLIARMSLSDLPEAQLKVMREAAADRNADRRWLSVHEVSVIELMRSLRPEMVVRGLPTDDRRAIIAALAR
jgi:hypothetical protein